jgi:hypothetical protein
MLDQINRDVVCKVIEHEQAKGNRPATVNRYLALEASRWTVMRLPYSGSRSASTSDIASRIVANPFAMS